MKYLNDTNNFLLIWSAINNLNSDEMLPFQLNLFSSTLLQSTNWWVSNNNSIYDDNNHYYYWKVRKMRILTGKLYVYESMAMIDRNACNDL